MKVVLGLVAAVLLAACAADPNSQPNLVQRAKVLSANDASITIEHSEWGKPIAFRLAEEHCGRMRKSAVYTSGVMQIGPDMTSTWRCQ